MRLICCLLPQLTSPKFFNGFKSGRTEKRLLVTLLTDHITYPTLSKIVTFVYLAFVHYIILNIFFFSSDFGVFTL